MCSVLLGIPQAECAAPPGSALQPRTARQLPQAERSPGVRRDGVGAGEEVLEGEGGGRG